MATLLYDVTVLKVEEDQKLAPPLVVLPTIAAAAFLGLLLGRVFVPLRRRTSASPRRPQARRLARLHTRRSGAAVEVEACRCCFVVQSGGRGGFRLQQASSGRRRALERAQAGGRVAPELEQEGRSRRIRRHGRGCSCLCLDGLFLVLAELTPDGRPIDAELVMARCLFIVSSSC